MRSWLPRLALVTAGWALCMGRGPEAAFAGHGSTATSALRELFDAADETSLRLDPMSALARGDVRYADELGYDISDRHFRERRAAAAENLLRLKQVRRQALDLPDQLAYDAFKWKNEIELEALGREHLSITTGLIVEHFTGFHLDYADQASGNGLAPFKTMADYESNLKRHARYARFIDAVIAQLRVSMAAGITQPKVIVAKVIEQLDVQLRDGGDAIFHRPVRQYPPDMDPNDALRLDAAYQTVTRETIVPALTRLRGFLKDDYVLRARDTIGLGQLPGGAALYLLAIKQSTTLSLKPDEIHGFGLAEVKRIHAQMEDVKHAIGFRGSLHELFEHLRTDPKLRVRSEEDIQREFESISRTVTAHLREQFSTLPQGHLEIRPQPSYKEIPGSRRQTGASGYYQAGTDDGSRPGIFFYVVGSTPEIDAIFLHEALPGHHLQASLARENTALPRFMRFGGPMAYSEGWALYAETLWRELGVETDPYRRFGGLNAEIVRAMRLVVDTGIHAKGWSREQAITYMMENSGLGRPEAGSATDRYIATPGQALAYKIGERTILQLKARARKQLGDRFDARAFHDQILSTGALPLAVLEAKVARWLSSQRSCKSEHSSQAHCRVRGCVVPRALPQVSLR